MDNKRQPRRSKPPRPVRKVPARETTSWDPVAQWYDQLVGKGGSDYHRHVILPAALEMLGEVRGQHGLDLCCGQGVLIGPLLERGVAALTGVDASRLLIRAAHARFPAEPKVRLLVADACAPAADWADGHYDFVACLMAIHDVQDLSALARNAARALKSGGRLTAVFMHPCFRIPRQTHWGWDEGRRLQYRRIDRYGVELEIPIVTHPSKDQAGQTMFYHRPLATVLQAFCSAGLQVAEMRELYSHRRSQAGGLRSKGEHRAAREFPVFLALGLVKV